MKIKTLLLFVFLTNTIIGQVNEIMVITNAVSNKISKNKKTKLEEKYSFKRKFGNDSVLVLRVPNEKIKSKYNNYVEEIQKTLDTAYNCYTSSRHIKCEKISNLITLLKIYDSDWPTSLYTQELSVYEQYDKKLYDEEYAKRQFAMKRRKEISDSVAFLYEQKNKRIADSLMVVNLNNKKQKELEYKNAQESSDENSSVIYSTTKKQQTKKDKFRSSSGYYQYYRGPKGGCYYINSNGKKVYVDHSYCN